MDGATLVIFLKSPLFQFFKYYEIAGITSFVDPAIFYSHFYGAIRFFIVDAAFETATSYVFKFRIKVLQLFWFDIKRFKNRKTGRIYDASFDLIQIDQFALPCCLLAFLGLFDNIARFKLKRRR